MSSQSTLNVGLLGHTGRIGSVVLKHFAAVHQKAFNLVVLHRQDSDLSAIPSGIETRQVDLTADDGDHFDEVVKDLHVLISTVSHLAVQDQSSLIPALSRSKDFITFFPSDLGAVWTKEETEGNTLAQLNVKDEVIETARKAGVPVTVPRAGLVTEMGFSLSDAGVGARENVVNFYGKSLDNLKPLTSYAYIAESYIQLLKDPKAVANKEVTFLEQQVSDREIAKILEKVHGTPPRLIEWDEKKINEALHSGNIFAALGAGLLKKTAENANNYPGERVVLPGWKSESIEEVVKKAAGKA